MKIIKIKKKAQNLYTVTFRERTLFGYKEFDRDVYNWCGYVRYSDDNSYTNLDETIVNLINALNGYEPLEIN